MGIEYTIDDQLVVVAAYGPFTMAEVFLTFGKIMVDPGLKPPAHVLLDARHTDHGPPNEEIEALAEHLGGLKAYFGGRWAVVSDYGVRGSEGNTLTIIDVPAARVARTIDLGDHSRPHGMRWLDERRVLVTTEGSRSVVVVDVVDGEITSFASIAGAAVGSGLATASVLKAANSGAKAASKASALGRNIDKPRALAKSVTVG